jgi:probable HAF family extracellular repeat protein
VIAAANAQGAFLFDSRSGQVLFNFPEGDTATALSNNGTAAGWSVAAGSVWLESDGRFQDIPLAHALSVNNDGMVAGFAGGFFVHAVVYSPADGSATTISLGGTQSVAFAVNSAGQVAGHSSLPGGFTQHAFLWSAGVIQDLGTLGGDTSYGLGIDEDGRVVGSAVTSNNQRHAYVFDGAGMHDLGTLPGCTRSEATAIRGPLIVGDSDLCGFAGSHAFVSDGSSLTDLNEVAQAPDGFTYVSARGVNSAGTLFGIAVSPDGRSTRPFVLVRSHDGE